MKFEKHPINSVKKFAEGLNGKVDIFLSVYKYVPLKKEDDRDNFWVNSNKLNYQYLEKLFDEMEDGFDLSFNSLIKIGDQTKHVPLIDFSGELTLKKIEILKDILPESYLNKLHIFFSGRSYHGYILHPITHKEWVGFMGTLLLLNLPNEEPIADQRWIGHRLRAGFSSLRWSYKSKSEKNFLPTYKGTIKDLLNEADKILKETGTPIS